MTYTTQAIVLKNISAREFDAAIVLYTRDFGKMRATAAGVKKQEAKLKGHLEPLSMSIVQFVLGVQGERLTYAQMVQSWPSMRIDFDRYGAAAYMAESIDRNCLTGQKDHAIWELLVGNCAVLGQERPVNVRELMGEFDRDLLEILGYAGQKDMETINPTLARPFGLIYNNM